MTIFHLLWSEIAQHVMNGITLGSIYALIALGYTMVYGILKFINFAHGEILMMGAYAGYFFYLGLNGDVLRPYSLFLFLVAMVGAMGVSALLGVTVEKLAYKPLRQAPRLAPILSAIGVSIILSNLAAFLFGTKSKRLDYPFANETILLGTVAITPHQILIVVSAVVLMVTLKIFVDYTRLGKAMRATSHNMTVAKFMGIDTDFIISLTFAICPAVKPLALANVYRVAQAVNLPIIASGGVACGEDALEFLLAGARLVEIGTTAFVKPKLPIEVVEFLEKNCGDVRPTPLR